MKNTKAKYCWHRLLLQH